MLSVLDIFRVGIGPSSSHTVGPMRIALRFRQRLRKKGLVERTARIKVIFRGSLAFTGQGHGTMRATMLGLLGFTPETIDMAKAEAKLVALAREKTLTWKGHVISFDLDDDLILDYETPTNLHPNEMTLRSLDANGKCLDKRTYYSTGGGFIASHVQMSKPVRNDIIPTAADVPHVFNSAAELLAICHSEGINFADVIRLNEAAMRPCAETDAALDHITEVMMGCIERGLRTEGILPGGLKVNRRAAKLWARLQGNLGSNEKESLFDWLNVFAMAVNEENAAGGQVVTAPTNGAAGIIPAVLRYYTGNDQGQPDMAKCRTFLLTAGAIGLLYKQRASISGAEMGCQGEVGVACSMAAGGLAAIWGGTPIQIANAAEIGMEHNLGLTCDPVGGLVQIPCIERNAIGAVKAANAARLSLHGTEHSKVSLDQVIETMRQTGLDMSSKYKETSQGGLAVNVVEC
ncbi:L-serine ammonia-lyase [Litorimonas sp. RW-G-Af-16]|uniref:L-serine ammonia-lyase n=1 Tax=Litorimonas sp. RW-G-Af-16 TaxID=3241168 RepID=UPI00390CA51F